MTLLMIWTVLGINFSSLSWSFNLKHFHPKLQPVIAKGAIFFCISFCLFVPYIEIVTCVSDEDEESSLDSDSSKTGTSRGTATGGSTHIHLWQFLKELLGSPQTHGSCIRWIDRTKGIFKIEDSVKVARLWGKRKNRPAMNYDKLSRSIRQYYKKGIMKKTERSQRLVYQFCHPYSL